MKLTFGNMSIVLNVFNVGNQPNELSEQYVGVNLIDEVVSWSNLDDSVNESLLEEDVLREYESNKELHELYRNLTSDDMSEELNAICSKHETQLEVISIEPKSIFKTSVGKPPPPDLNSSFSRLDLSLVVDNETHHDVILVT